MMMTMSMSMRRAVSPLCDAADDVNVDDTDTDARTRTRMTRDDDIGDVIDDRARALYASAYERIEPRASGGGGPSLGLPLDDDDADAESRAAGAGVFIVTIARDVRCATLHGSVMRVAVDDDDAEGGRALARGGDARLADVGASRAYAHDMRAKGRESSSGDAPSSVLTRARVRCLRELAITRTLESVRDELEREREKANLARDVDDDFNDDDDARARKRERKKEKKAEKKSAKKAKK